MIVIYFILSILVMGIFMYLSRWSGWKKDVGKQIDNYKQLRRQLPDANENNLASRLLRIKIKNDPNPSLKKHYETLSSQSGLTLRNTLFFIIEYDYIRGRGLNPVESGPMLFLNKVKEHIDFTVRKEFPEGA